MAFGRRQPPPRRERDPDEFASVVIERPRAVMRRADAPKDKLAPRALTDLAPQRVTVGTTAAEREYMGRVARLGCVVCRLLGFGPTPAQVHHVRAGQGGAQRAGNYCVLPLCEPDHTGPRGIHGDKSRLRQLGMTEMDLLDVTIGEAMR